MYEIAQNKTIYYIKMSEKNYQFGEYFDWQPCWNKVTAVTLLLGQGVYKRWVEIYDPSPLINIAPQVNVIIWLNPR